MKYSWGVFLCFLFVWTASSRSVVSKDGDERGGLSTETKSERLSKRSKCCRLGREVAKIGDVCSYTESLAALKPDPRHFHVMKTSLWQKQGANPINSRKLQKCKRFKAYYEKCCQTEAANISKDIKRHSDKQRSNSVQEIQTGRR